VNASIEHNGNLMIVYIAGEIDHHSAKALREQIDNAVIHNRPERLIMDFRHVSFMDSSGIGLVLGRVQIMQHYHGNVEVRNVSPQTNRIMKLSGIGSVATIKEV